MQAIMSEAIMSEAKRPKTAADAVDSYLLQVLVSFL
jgi:hypothetical protein